MQIPTVIAFVFDLKLWVIKLIFLTSERHLNYSPKVGLLKEPNLESKPGAAKHRKLNLCSKKNGWGAQISNTGRLLFGTI